MLSRNVNRKKGMERPFVCFYRMKALMVLVVCSLALPLVGCIRVPDEVRATLAPAAPAEKSNFRKEPSRSGASATSTTTTTSTVLPTAAANSSRHGASP
jgi:hypothetical protein